MTSGHKVKNIRVKSSTFDYAKEHFTGTKN